MKIVRLETTAKSSRVVTYNGIAYLSGLTPSDATADVPTQARQVLARIDEYLSRAGTDKSHLLSATIWTRDIQSVPLINQVWESWLPFGCAPARTCVQASPASSQFAIEITVTAAISETQEGK